MNIKEQSLKLYKTNLSKTIGFSFLYGSFVLMCLAIAYFLPPSLIITVPFVILPFTFALQVTVTHINNNFPALFKIFFVGYKMYFSPKGMGCYRSLHGFLKSLAVFMFYETLIEVVGIAIAMNKDASLVSLMESFSLENLTYESYMGFLDALMINESFVIIMTISTLTGMLFAFYMFAHNVFTHGMKANLAMYNPAPEMSMGVFNAMHKQFFRVIRKDFYKNYYSTIWMLIPIYIVFYCGGACLGYFLIPSADILQLQVLALAVAFIFSIPLLPLMCTLLEQLYKKYAPKYNELGFKSVRESFDELMKSKKLSDDQKKSLEDMMKVAEEKEQASSKEDEKKEE